MISFHILVYYKVWEVDETMPLDYFFTNPLPWHAYTFMLFAFLDAATAHCSVLNVVTIVCWLGSLPTKTSPSRGYNTTLEKVTHLPVLKCFFLIFSNYLTLALLCLLSSPLLEDPRCNGKCPGKCRNVPCFWYNWIDWSNW